MHTALHFQLPMGTEIKVSPPLLIEILVLWPGLLSIWLFRFESLKLMQRGCFYWKWIYINTSTHHNYFHLDVLNHHSNRTIRPKEYCPCVHLTWTDTNHDWCSHWYLVWQDQLDLILWHASFLQPSLSFFLGFTHHQSLSLSKEIGQQNLQQMSQ